ncbi:hypothetical protein [Polynucleobacter sp. JS-Fieb-80-E5]|uniref:hypothetical protein n=1 Tax=Polynucleobacter sp. JS-Fieb-80-E5 TaxID=2081050 RepID=UPI001C0B308B|nr:hypothetical protein [Polynucleobacter sp. JS-Fieb-80-E5]MBU3618568.1 hypothetical protein [Polynucleobacter sp. JS-Fieb-80-E5]
MKIKLALITLLLPTAVFAQAGKSQENAGYQGTTSATQGLGASNPNAGKGNSGQTPGYQGTTNAQKGYGSANPTSGTVIVPGAGMNNANGVNPAAVNPR